MLHEWTLDWKQFTIHIYHILMWYILACRYSHFENRNLMSEKFRWKSGTEKDLKTELAIIFETQDYNENDCSLPKWFDWKVSLKKKIMLLTLKWIKAKKLKEKFCILFGGTPSKHAKHIHAKFEKSQLIHENIEQWFMAFPSRYCDKNLLSMACRVVFQV